MPMASPESPPGSWHLSAEGRAAASALSGVLPARARLVSSDEPKAWETLGGSSEVTRDSRFNEIIRLGKPWEGNFRELRRLYLEGAAHPGWEPPADAAERFEAGVSDALHEQDDGPTVIATHGMVMTTWLVSRGAVAQSAAAGFWSDLRFPDCFILEADDSMWWTAAAMGASLSITGPGQASVPGHRDWLAPVAGGPRYPTGIQRCAARTGLTVGGSRGRGTRSAGSGSG